MSELLNELKKAIKLLLESHHAMIQEFIPAQAGLDPERAKVLTIRIAAIEKVIRDLQDAKTTDELSAVLKTTNSLFEPKQK